MELLPHFHTRSQSLAHIFEIWLFLMLSLALFHQEDLATLVHCLISHVNKTRHVCASNSTLKVLDVLSL